MKSSLIQFREQLGDSLDRHELIDAIIELIDDVDWVLEWVSENYFPDSVFTKKQLDDWAKENGYEKV